MKATATPWKKKSQTMSETNPQIPNSPTVGSPPAGVPFVEFHIIKAPFFRTIHADGIWFSFSPNKTIRLGFFNERIPIPKRVFMKVDDAGILTDEIVASRDTRTGYVREMEADVVMTLETAKALQIWLNENLEKLK
jgi:hypothetical protein